MRYSVKEHINRRVFFTNKIKTRGEINNGR